MTDQSTSRSTRLDLPILLPDAHGEQDACVERLIRLLETEDGVRRAHVVPGGEQSGNGNSGDAESARTAVAQLCMHYDPDLLSLSRITEIAHIAGASLTERFAHIVLPFRAVGSEDNGRRLESGLRALKGVTEASVNHPGQVARIEYDTRQTNGTLIEQRLRDLTTGGEELEEQRNASAPRRSDDDSRQETPSDGGSVESIGWYARNRELVWSLLAGLLLIVGWTIDRFGDVSAGIPLALYIASYVFGARDNIAHFVADLKKGKFHFNIDFLMVVAAVGAAILGQWVEGALLLFLFSLGHALEHYALGRARHAISALAELAPTRAIVIREEKGVQREVEVPIEQVRPGDLVVVKPAGRIPVDGEVSDGRSSVNQAPITGESVPVHKEAGDPVFAGSVNGDGALVVLVTAAIGDRTLDRVISLVAEAETQKAPTQQFTDGFERVFVPIVLVADILLIVLPPLFGFWTLEQSFYRAMALLIAASPCALALGTPAAVLAGIAQAARRGVLIKGGAYLEALGGIQVLALDKTGTITKGEPEVTDVVPSADVTSDELLSVTASVEQRSQHPLARAILAAADQRKLSVPVAGELEAITGRGVRSSIDGREVFAGRLLMYEEMSAGDSDFIPAEITDAVQAMELAGRSTMVVRRENSWMGVIGLADVPRHGVAATLEALRKVGIQHIVMLTGDNAGVGRAIGNAVGIDDVRAGLLPEDKVAAVKEIVASRKVAMVGDGVNDAPALAHATVGIAMGGAGTAAALETADVALMGDDLSRLPFAIGLSRQARRIIKQNLFIALGVISLLVITTVSGVIGIGPAVVMHEGSTLVVILNALRLLRYSGPEL